MAFYNNFWTLKGSTSYTTHIVGQFDANCSSGGGVFKWVSANNTSILDIPGFRIKPSAVTTGYWERVYDGPINVGWFGTQNTTSVPSTFAALGISQTTLDSRYGAGFATTTDNYDTTAIRYALKMMGTLGYQSLIFEPKNYWLTRTCELPVNNPTITSITGRGMFVIDGNGATIQKSIDAQFDFFFRAPATQTEADALYIDNAFTIKNFNALNNGSTILGSGKAFLNLGATYGSIIENIFVKKFDVGIKLEFCMNAQVTNIFANSSYSYSVLVKNGSWPGADTSHGQSNGTVVSNVRVFDTEDQIAGIAVIDADTCVVKNCIIEGRIGANPGTPQYGILWDSIGATVTPNFRVQDCHIETPCTKGAIWLKPRAAGRYIVDNIYIQNGQTLVGIEEGLPSTGGNYPDIYIANIPFKPSGMKFFNNSTGGFQPTWDFYNCRLGGGINSTATLLAATSLWDTTTTGGTIPTSGFVRVVSNIITS
jgi:hypothetical protein